MSLDPKELAKNYSRFRVTERVLLSGHSHQAWPDCSFDAQKEAWFDAAQHVDDKWQKAFQKASRVRKGFAKLLNDSNGEYSLGTSTHDLIIRWLSALPLKQKPRIITSDSEFHSLRRIFLGLKEWGVEVIQVPTHPVERFAEKMISQISEKTAAVITSSVFFNSGQIAQDLAAINDKCRKLGIPFLIDTYHHLNVVPFQMSGLEDTFIIGGGYKYCQMGEGNCFLRYPQNTKLKPLASGWMADFSHLEQKQAEKISFSGEGSLFAGATYDPVSHYRAARVFEFFEEQKLTPEKLRDLNQKQIRFLSSQIDKLDSPLLKRDQGVAIDRLGGFLALKSIKAHILCEKLKTQGIWTDYRGDVLRLGPAPYVGFEQLELAVAKIKVVVT